MPDMTSGFVHESPAYWDSDKARIVGGAPEGVFDFADQHEGDLVPGDWWHVEQDGKIVGYGWMDTVWGDAEVLVAVDPEARGSGIGTSIMDHLEQEARARGLNHLYNVIPDGHPDPTTLGRWLAKRGFSPSEDGRVLRRIVRRQLP